MPTLRLEDNELLDLFDSGSNEEFDALNDDEREWLKQLVTARDSGKALARHRWSQAKERLGTLQAATAQGGYPTPQGIIQPEAQQPRRLSLPPVPQGRYPGPVRLGMNIGKDIVNLPAGMADITAAAAEAIGGQTAALAGYPGAREYAEERGRELLEMGKGMAQFTGQSALALGNLGIGASPLERAQAMEFLAENPLNAPLSVVGAAAPFLPKSPKPGPVPRGAFETPPAELAAQAARRTANEEAILTGRAAIENDWRQRIEILEEQQRAAARAASVSEEARGQAFADKAGVKTYTDPQGRQRVLPPGEGIPEGVAEATQRVAREHAEFTHDRAMGGIEDPTPNLPSQGFARWSMEKGFAADPEAAAWLDKKDPARGFVLTKSEVDIAAKLAVANLKAQGKARKIPKGVKTPEGRIGEAGYIDMSPLYDLAAHFATKTKTYAEWVGQMVKHVGQIGADTLRKLWDQVRKAMEFSLAAVDKRLGVRGATPETEAQLAQRLHANPPGEATPQDFASVLAQHPELERFAAPEQAERRGNLPARQAVTQRAATVRNITQDYLTAVETLNNDLAEGRINGPQHSALLREVGRQFSEVIKPPPETEIPQLQGIPDILLDKRKQNELLGLPPETEAPPPEKGPAASFLGTQNIYEYLRDKGKQAPKSPMDVLAEVGAKIAHEIRGPVKGARVNALLNNEEWSRRMQAKMVENGLPPLTPADLQRLWHHPSVKLGRTGYPSGVDLRGAARPRGAWVAFMREAGHEGIGLGIANMVREILHRKNLGIRVVRETEKPLKAAVKQAERLSPDVETDLMLTLASVPVEGQPGAWLRFGTMSKAEAIAYIKETGSHILPDGLILDDPQHSVEGMTQIYKLVKADEAQGLIDKFRQEHPTAIPILETLMSKNKEIAEINVLGDQIPLLGFKHLREQYGIQGLTEEARLNELGRRLGLLDRNERYDIGYVPELAQLAAPRSSFGRLRNFLGFITAATRKRKTGAGLKGVWSKQATAKLIEGHRLSREGLIIEDAFNDGVTGALVLALEPIDPAVGVLPGNIPFTKHTFGTAGRFAKYLERNTDVFNQLGVHLDDGEPPAKRLRFQIRRGLADMLKPMFEDPFVSSDPAFQAAHDKLYSALDGLVSTANAARLTGLSTQLGQSARANAMMYAGRALRDAYRPLFAAMRGGPEGRLGEAADAMVQAISTIKAIPASLRPSVRDRIPLEALGESAARDLIGGPGKLRQIQSAVLTPMRAMDWASKWANTEASLDGAAHIAWNQAKRRGQVKGADKAQWIANYKENVPASVRALAAIESDAWGGFDFANVNRAVASVRGTHLGGPTSKWWGLAGRSIVPYPIFTYKKINNFYGQIAFAMNDAMKFGDPKSQVNGLATLAAFYTMYKVLDSLYESKRPTDLPAEVEGTGETVGEADLPFYQRKSMRLPLDEKWSQVSDVPILGEIAFINELQRRGVTLDEVMNSQIGLGIAPQFVHIMMGYSDKFQPKEASTANKMGTFVGSLLPAGPEFNVARKLYDPFRRDITAFRDPAHAAFYKAIANRYPVLSNNLPVALGRDKSILKYDPKEVTLSYLWANTTGPDEQDRALSIAQAKIAVMEKLNQEFTEDQIRATLMPLVDQEGYSKSTPLLKRQRDVEMALRVKALKLDLDMKRTYYTTHDEAKTIQAAMAVINSAPVELRSALSKRIKSNLATFITAEKVDPFLLDLKDAPPSVQLEFLPKPEEPPNGQ